MVQSLENIDKSKVYAGRIAGLDEVVEGIIDDTLTGAVSTITTSDLTANKILVSNANGKVAASTKAISDIPDDSDLVHTSGNETITGTKTFSSTISGSIDGNAATVTNGVYTSGNQTIAGNKTFSGTTAITGQLQSKRNNNDARILNYYANYTKGTAPTATQYSGIKIVDNAGTEIGDFYGRISTSNVNSAFMTVKDPGTGTTTKQIAIHFPADGTAYTEAPTPATSDNSTKIATTAYVKAQGYITSALKLPNYSSAANKAKGTQYTATNNCMIICNGNIATDSDRQTAVSYFYIDGAKYLELKHFNVYGSGSAPFSISVILKKGQTYKIASQDYNLNIYKYVEIPLTA